MTEPASVLIPLSDLNGAGIAEVGGKAANLGALITAGAPVPPGFVVTTDAYRLALRGTGLDDTIRAADFDTVRDRIADLTVPDELAEPIRAQYRRIGSPPVAVRSSGTAEDLADAAFAGQHDTFLNVVGETALLDAVRRCWASLWTDRAVEYRRDRKVDTDGIAIAVVVQRMVDSEAAGVMFTADPVTGERGHAVVDASPGLGESVVSGLVTPDHYVVDKRSGKPVETRIGRREVIIESVPGGGTRQSTGAADGRPVLDRSTLRRLVRIGSEVEKHFGAPQDTEWCLAGGRLYIVQARPITAIPDPLPRIDFRQRIGLSMLVELLPRRPYPLDVSGWIRPDIDGVADFMSSMGIRFPPLDSFLIERDGVLATVTPPKIGAGPLTPLIAIRNAMRGDRYTKAKLAEDPRMIRFRADVRAGMDRDLTTLSLSELADALRSASELFARMMRLRTRFLPKAVLATGRFGLTLTLLGARKDFALLIGGVDTLTAETNRRLEALATQIREDPDLSGVFAATEPDRLADVLSRTETGRRFWAAFTDFLRDYGHRESVMLLISAPTWIDAPHIVLGLLRTMAEAEPGPTHESPSEVAERRLFARRFLRRGPLARFVRRQLDRARGFTQFREDTHFYATMAHPVVRRILIEYADRLVTAGVLDDRDDVFYLHREELTGLDRLPLEPTARDALQDTVSTRRRVFAELDGTPLFDRRYLAAPPPDGVLVSGTAASGGVATGPVRIVRGPEDFGSLRPGEILVAPFTNPAWTPLFQRAAAAIVDTGAAMSHAAIVAREYGIPAVLGTADATGKLRDGQPVTVDGDRGLVLPAEDPG